MYSDFLLNVTAPKREIGYIYEPIVNLFLGSVQDNFFHRIGTLCKSGHLIKGMREWDKSGTQSAGFHSFRFIV